MSTKKLPQVAYFCMEYALESPFKIYAGGLGILAGDYLKGVKDHGYPMVGIGIRWKQGYGEQMVDADTGQGLTTPTRTAPRVPGGHGRRREGAHQSRLPRRADTLDADNSSEATITATVFDAFSNPVLPGTPVSFTADGGTITTSATTDAQGRAIVTFRAGLTIGPAAITATQNSKRGSLTIYLRGTTPATVTLNANPMRLIANGTTQSVLHVTVLDNQGRPVSDGTPVTFTAQQGTISAGTGTIIMKNRTSKTRSESAWTGALDAKRVSKTAKGGAAAVSPWVGVSRQFSLFTATTLNGQTSATLTSPTVAGPDTVAASAGTLRDAQALQYTSGPAALIQVTPQAGQLPADGISSTPLTCQVTDAFGNPVGSGLMISLTASIGTVSPASGYTAGDGVFHSTLIATRSRGLCAIVATTQGASGYGEVQFTAPQVAAVAVTSDVISVLANGISTAAITAVGVDAYGIPVPGATFAWQIEPGLGRLIPYTIVADSLGSVSAIFVSSASRTDADQTITAQSGGHSGQHVIHMLGVTLQAWTDVAQIPGDGSSATNVNVLLREKFQRFRDQQRNAALRRIGRLDCA